MSLQALYMNQNWTVAQLVERIKQDRVNLNLSPGVYQFGKVTMICSAW